MDDIAREIEKVENNIKKIEQQQREQEEKRAEERAEERKKLNAQKQAKEEKQAEDSDDAMKDVLNLIDTTNLKKISDIKKIVKYQQQNSNLKETEKYLKNLDEIRPTTDIELYKRCENSKKLNEQIIIYKEEKQKYNSVCNDSSISDEEKLECRTRIVKTLLAMRLEIYKIDKKMREELEDPNNILNAKEDVEKFSNLFASPQFNCDDSLKAHSLTEYFQCLVEKGMMYASILYAKQKAANKDKDIQFLCDLLISENTEKAINLYVFYSNLQRCLAKIQKKIFTINYKLNETEKELLESMRQVPVVKALHGETSPNFDKIVIKIYNLVQLLNNNNDLILAFKEVKDEDAALLRQSFAKYEQPYITCITFCNFVLCIVCVGLYYAYLKPYTKEMLEKQEEQEYTNRTDFAKTLTVVAQNVKYWRQLVVEETSNEVRVLAQANSYAPYFYEFCGGVATYGFIQMLINSKISQTYILDRFLYASKQHRIEACAESIITAEQFIQEQRTIHYYLGGYKIFLATAGMVLLFRAQSSLEALYKDIFNSYMMSLFSISTIFVPQMTSLTTSMFAVNRIADNKNKAELNLKNLAGRILLRSIGKGLVFAGAVDEKSLDLLTKNVQDFEQYIDEASKYIKTIATGLDKSTIEAMAKDLAREYKKRRRLSLIDNQKTVSLKNIDIEYFEKSPKIKKLLDERSKLIEFIEKDTVQKTIRDTGSLHYKTIKLLKNIPEDVESTNVNEKYAVLNLRNMFGLFSNSKTSNLFKDHLKF